MAFAFFAAEPFRVGELPQMNLRTDINPRYLLRMGLVGLFCVGSALWFLYDGLYTYPAQREQSLAYLEFKEANPDLAVMQLFEKWKEVAAEKGWPAGSAGKPQTPYGPPKKEYDINGQFYFSGLAGLVGLFFLGKLLYNWGRWIEADDEGLRSSENRAVKFDEVTALNKKKWQNKGIAKLVYEENGKKRRIVLDDCNYDRKTTNTILRHVESKIGPEKIINGKPEPPLTPATPASEPASTSG